MRRQQVSINRCRVEALLEAAEFIGNMEWADKEGEREAGKWLEARLRKQAEHLEKRLPPISAAASSD